MLAASANMFLIVWNAVLSLMETVSVICLPVYFYKLVILFALTMLFNYCGKPG